MRITICGHAGLYVETEDQRLLVDPILKTDRIADGLLEHAWPRALSYRRMPRPSALILTHAHVDHFDLPTLKMLPKDLPVILPADKKMLQDLRSLGFKELRVLADWESVRLGSTKVTASPSFSGVVEIGLIVEDSTGRFWHMSDAEVDAQVGQKIVEKLGRVDVVSVKFQPAGIEHSIMRSLGAWFEKGPVIQWLEAAVASSPRFAFPYAAGLRFRGHHSWLNRYAFPFRAADIAKLLSMRLGNDGRSSVVEPGDVIEVTQDGVDVDTQGAEFVRRRAASKEPEWEPVETERLIGFSSASSRRRLRRLLEDFFAGPFARWLPTALAPSGVMRSFPNYAVVWQMVIHSGSGERLCFALDCSEEKITLTEGMHPGGNYFTHYAGASLKRILEKRAGAELLYLGGDTRSYEKIVTVRNGGFWAPPHKGWDLFEALPDPLMMYFRYQSG